MCFLRLRCDEIMEDWMKEDEVDDGKVSQADAMCVL